MNFGRRIGRLAAWAAVVVLGPYVAVLALLFTVQDRLIYPGWWRGTHRYSIEGSGYRMVPLRAADGQIGRLLYHSAQPGRPVILFLHGNGDNASGVVTTLPRFVAAGYGVVAPEYRGYDGLPGVPNERGIYRDARAARAWLARQGIGADRTILIGYSLGTGIAAQLASEQVPRALVLMAPYSSMVDVVRDRMPWIPGFLVTERFDTAAKIGAIACPVLLLHGAVDATIPAIGSARLLLAQPHAERMVFRGVGHEVGFLPAVHGIVLGWLSANGS